MWSNHRDDRKFTSLSVTLGIAVFAFTVGFLFSPQVKVSFLRIIDRIGINEISLKKDIDNTRSKGSLAKYKIKSLYANARRGPGTHYDVVNILPRNNVVIVVGKRGNWLKIGNGSWISNITASKLPKVRAERPSDFGYGFISVFDFLNFR